jgi:hypothetical protein
MACAIAPLLLTATVLLLKIMGHCYFIKDKGNSHRVVRNIAGRFKKFSHCN